MTDLLKVDAEERRHLLRRGLILFVIFFPILTALIAYVAGFKTATPRLEFLSLQIIGSDQIHAGNNIRVREEAIAPPGCILKFERWIEFKPDGLSNGRPLNQMLTDTSSPMNGGDIFVFTTIHILQGAGTYHERVQAPDCGAWSGVRSAPSREARPVPITILPPLPVLAVDDSTRSAASRPDAGPAPSGRSVR